MGTQRSKLEILIESILHGTGFQDAEKGMTGTGSAAGVFASHLDDATAASHRLVRAEAVQTQAANQLRDAQKTLAEITGKVGADAQQEFEKAVVDAKKALAAAEEETKDAKKALSDLSGETKDAGSRFQKFGLTLVDIKSGLDMVAGAMRTAAQLAKQGLELAELGAQAKQTISSFEGLRDELGLSTDYMDQLREASRNTLGTLDLMGGLGTLVAGSSREMGQALAGAYPQLVEYAKAASKLNPHLGDTTHMLESIALGIKRNSPMILDNLGIMVKVGEANEQYAASIGKAVDALTAEDQQMALLNATLEAGNRLIEQVGGSTAAMTDQFEQLRVATGEAKTELALLWAEMINVSDAAKGLSELTTLVRLQRLLEDAEQLGTLSEDALEAIRKASRVTLPMTPADWDRMATAAAESIVVLEQRIVDATGASEGARFANWNLTRSHEDLGRATYDAVERFERLTRAQRDVADAAVAGVTYWVGYEEQLKGVGSALNEAKTAAEYAAEAAAEAGTELVTISDTAMAGTFRNQTQLLEDLAEAESTLDLAHQGLIGTWRENKTAAEEAEVKIRGLTEAISESYKTMLFETLYGEQMAEGTFTEQMAAQAVGLGIIEQETATRMVEVAGVNALIREGVETFHQTMTEWDPAVMNSWVDKIASGEADSITGALLLATEEVHGVKGALSGPDSLQESIGLLEEPIVTFRTTMGTEMGTVKTEIGYVQDDLEIMLSTLQEIGQTVVRPRVEVGLSGEGASLLAEARARGQRP